MKKLFLSLIVLFFSPTLFAKGYFLGGGLYQSDATGASGTAATTRILMNFGLGYLAEETWGVGITYFSDSHGETNKQSGVGLSGLLVPQDMPLMMMATYYPSAEWNGGGTPIKGSGFQVDIGYRIKSGKMSFIPQLSYRDIKYKPDGGVELVSRKIDPMFMFMAEF